MFLSARRDLETRQVGTDLILYDLINKTLHVLNVTAAKVFQLCDGLRTEEEIAHALSESFDDANPVQIYHDVKRTLNVFKVKNIVTQEAGRLIA